MKNQNKLEIMGLQGRERYYYLKYGKNDHGTGIDGTAAVCVIPFEVDGLTVYARGVAFCNPADQFVKKLGRAIALGRAIKAIESGCCTDSIPKKKPAWLLHAYFGWTHFSCARANLSGYERRLFNLE